MKQMGIRVSTALVEKLRVIAGQRQIKTKEFVPIVGLVEEALQDFIKKEEEK